MSVISNISVGDIQFYEVDNFPTHTAPKGSVAMENVGGKVFVNVDGGTLWLKTVTSEYGNMYFNGNTTGRDTTQNSWVNLNGITWTEGFTKGFNMSVNAELTYTGTSLIKVLTKLTSTIGAGASKWMDFEAGQAKNNIVPQLYQGGTGIDNANRVSISNGRFEPMVNGDYINVGLRWTDREGGGSAAQRTYIPREVTINVIKIDESLTIFNEDWESNSFTTNGWSVVNDSENIWVIGTAENNTVGGSYGAYISNDGGTSATYNINNSEISHFYRDFEISSTLSSAVITFDWICWGENAAGATQYDYGAVVLADTGTTPTAASEVNTAQATTDGGGNPTGNGRIGATSNLGKFNLAYGGSNNNWKTEFIDLSNFIGQTKRVIFTWVNDGSVGVNNPFCIDNIKLETF